MAAKLSEGWEIDRLSGLELICVKDIVTKFGKEM